MYIKQGVKTFCKKLKLIITRMIAINVSNPNLKVDRHWGFQRWQLCLQGFTCNKGERPLLGTCCIS